jgi:prepilin-type processing-associated H-X9-DG protein
VIVIGSERAGLDLNLPGYTVCCIYTLWETMTMLHNRRPGFALIDLVVLVAILAILLGMFLPAAEKIRDAASNGNCKSNLRQIAIGLNDHDAQLTYLPIPSGAVGAPKKGTLGKLPSDPKYGNYTVLVQISPYCEADLAVEGKKDVAIYTCPADASFKPDTAGTSYGVNITGWDAAQGAPQSDFSTLAQIPAGTSNVIAAGDYTQQGVVNYYTAGPGQSEQPFTGLLGAKATITGKGYDKVFASFHAGPKVNVVLFDGHVVSTNNQKSVQDGVKPNKGNVQGTW